MAEKSKAKNTSKRRKKPHFLVLNKRNFSKLALNYHHEVRYLIYYLIQTTQRLNESAAMCQYFIDGISSKKGIKPKRSSLEHFEDTIYHLENHAFRASAYRDKLLQFINQALQLGYDERERGLVQKLIKNRISIEALTNTEIKKFQKDPALKNTISRRVSLSHLRYYSQETFHSPYLYPVSTNPDNRKNFTREWKKNISEQVETANKFTEKAMDIADKVMIKINNYWKKRK